MSETVWDEVIAGSRPRQASTTASRCSPLRLRRAPERAWLTDKAREAALIDTSLRACLRELVAGRAPWPLFVFGPPGTGKTCACLALLDHAGGLYFTAQGLADAAIEAAKGRLVSPDGRQIAQAALWRELGTANVVCLDELGARERVSDWCYEQVKRLLDLREGRPLVACSNLPVSRLAALYDDRLASRLAAGTLVALDGPDRRIDRRLS